MPRASTMITAIFSCVAAPGLGAASQPQAGHGGEQHSPIDHQHPRPVPPPDHLRSRSDSLCIRNPPGRAAQSPDDDVK